MVQSPNKKNALASLYKRAQERGISSSDFAKAYKKSSFSWPELPKQQTANNTSNINKSSVNSPREEKPPMQTVPNMNVMDKTSSPRQTAKPLWLWATNIYGDVWGWDRQTFNQKGVWLSTWETQQQNLRSLTWTESFLKFWQQARDLEAKTPWFLSRRNDAIAQDLFQRWVRDPQAIQQALAADQWFASSSMEDQMNTAQAIAARMWGMQEQEPEVVAQDQADVTIQQRDTGLPNLDELYRPETNKKIQEEQQKFLQDVARQWTLYDRKKEDLKMRQERQNKDLTRQLQLTERNLNNQMADVKMQMERDVSVSEKVGALKWFNRSSWYVQGIENIRNDAMRTIGRLQDTLMDAQTATWQAKSRLMEDYNKQLWRAKQDFDFQMRDLMNLATIDVNEVIGKYGLSDEKMGERLEIISMDLEERRLWMVNKYLWNINSANNIVNSQMDQLMTLNNYVTQQQSQFTNMLEANWGANLMWLSPDMLLDYVEKGYLSPEKADMYEAAMFNKSIATLREYGQVTTADTTAIKWLLAEWLTPEEAITTVMESNPNRYNPLAPKTFQDQIRMQQLWMQQQQFGQEMELWELQLQQMQQKVQQSELDTRAKRREVIGEISQSAGGGIQGAYAVAASYPDWSKWWQCWEWANDIFLKSWLSSPWSQVRFGDTLASKTDAINSQSPQVWSAIVMSMPWTKFEKNWHVGIVQAVNPDGSVVMKSSNFKWDETVTTDVLQANDPRIQGYVVPQQAEQVWEVAIQPTIKLSDLTQTQQKNYAFATRLNNAVNVANDLEDYISWLSTAWFALQERLPRAAQSESFKRYDDTVREFINAQLRQESWAAIWQDEYESARREYFPVPWDSQAIIEDKKRRREQAVRNMVSMAWLSSLSDVQGFEQDTQQPTWVSGDIALQQEQQGMSITPQQYQTMDQTQQQQSIDQILSQFNLQ